MTRRATDETALTQSLRALADEETRVETPEHVEAALMARFDEYRRTPRVLRRRTRTLVRGAATMAAGVMLFGAVMLERELAPVRIDLPRRPPAPSGSMDPTLPPIASGDDSAVPRPIDSRPSEPRSTVVLVGGPIASGELVQAVRMRVDRSALTALGITQSGSNDTVEVDVLVGEDGVARGLRLPL
jgi:hypothetical protein